MAGEEGSVHGGVGAGICGRFPHIGGKGNSPPGGPVHCNHVDVLKTDIICFRK